MRSRTFIIAELSANHNNDFDLAAKTIRAMAEAGADAVKLQTYRAESLTINLDTGLFAPRTEGLWKGYTPWQLYNEAAMPYEWQPKLKRMAEELGMELFSSPFDKEGVDFLDAMGVKRYKIASPEITDLPLIEYVASKGKPVIISTGLAELDDIQRVLDICQNQKNRDITLLKCTSQYPASIEDANLCMIPDMKNRFGVKVGVSDHTPGSIVPALAVSAGATVVEKHFILSRSMGGPDAPFSMEPGEFREMVRAVRQAEKVMGEISYKLPEKDLLRRRSLFVVRDIRAGEEITEENVRSIRPGHGLHPQHFPLVIGKKAICDLKAGTPFTGDLAD